jgi:arabinose-5-phosphate isomerase
MSTDAALAASLANPLEQLRFGRQVLQQEARAVLELAQRLDKAFCRAADLIFHCQGSVIVTGMGKAGLVGQKIVATLASTGTPSHWLHPAEAVHGDLGRIRPCDVVLVLSQSGETEEIVRLLPSLRALGPPIIAVTGDLASTLGRAASVVIDLGSLEEACPLGLAPTTSSTAMLAVGDALALVVSRMRGFHREDFARFHPAGSLGRKLSKVDDHLRPLAQCRVAREDMTVREVFVRLSTPGRRTGAIMLVDQSGRLAGIFTDSDLARLFERRRDRELDATIREVMTSNPVTIPLGSPMTEAVAILAQRKISELPVVDEQGRPAGLIDVTDVVGLLPQELPEGESLPAAGTLTPGVRPKPSYRVFREPQEGDVA